jgi:ABC-2 type transport system permease protein
VTVLRPGSLPWLFLHEARLSWRDALGTLGFDPRRYNRGRILWLVAVYGFFQAAAIFAVGALAEIPAQLEVSAAALLPAISMALALPWALMVARALHTIAHALYGRGDLSLLLSSPLAPWRILAVRAVITTLSCSGGFALLITPILAACAVHGQPRWLTAYPLLLALACLAVALSLLIRRALFGLLGPERTRIAAQIAAAALVAGALLLLQIQRLTPTDAAWLAGPAEGASRDPANPIWWPARALLGDLLAMLALLVTAAGALTATVVSNSRWFCRSAIDVAGIGQPPSRSRPLRLATLRFGITARSALRRKEALLLLRDPWLLSQLLLEIVFLVPLVFLFWRPGGETHLPLVGPLPILVAARLGGGLGWIVIAGEDSPDLVGSAPLTRRTLIRAKAEVVAAALSVTLLIPLASLAYLSLWAAGWVLLGCAAAASSAFATQLWFACPASRRDFRMRLTRAKLASFAEAGVSLLLAIAAGMAIAELAAGFAPLCLAMALMTGLRSLSAGAEGQQALARGRRDGPFRPARPWGAKRPAISARDALILGTAAVLLLIVGAGPVSRTLGGISALLPDWDSFEIYMAPDRQEAAGRVAIRRAKAAHRRREHDLALRHWDEGIPLLRGPAERAEAYDQRGDELRWARRYDLALDSYAKAAALDDRPDPDRRLRIGRAYLEMKRPEEALAEFRKYAEARPERASGQVDIGRALHMLGRDEEAYHALKKALEIDPKDENAIYDLAWLFLNTGQDDNAIAVLERGVAIAGRWFKPSFLSARCRAHTNKGNYESALADCNEAVRLNPRNAFGLKQRGALHEAMRDRAKARADYMTALTRDPGDPWTLKALKRVESEP